VRRLQNGLGCVVRRQVRVEARRLVAERAAAAAQPPQAYDPQTNAPVKFDEFFELRQFLGLRSRPRVDYSSSSSGQHIWRTTTGGYKRKQREESSDTDDEKNDPPLEVLDVSIFGDIDLERVRATKRARHESADEDDELLLADLAAQEHAPPPVWNGDGDDDPVEDKDAAAEPESNVQPAEVDAMDIDNDVPRHAPFNNDEDDNNNLADADNL